MDEQHTPRKINKNTVSYKRCIVKSCLSYARLEHLSCFSFPKNEKRNLLWKKACGLEISTKTKCLYLCENHFSKDQFFPRREGQRRNLIPSAVPNLMLSNVEFTISLPSTSAMRRSRRMEKNVDLKSKDLKDQPSTLNECTTNSQEMADIEMDTLDEEKEILYAEDDGKLLNQSKFDDIDFDTPINDSNDASHDETSECWEPEMDSSEHDSEDVFTDSLNEYAVTLEQLQKGTSGCKERTTLLSLIHDENDKELIAFCGISFSLLHSLSEAVTSHEGTTDLNCCTVVERVALTLCKLRLNLSFMCLGVLFQLESRNCSKYFYKTVESLTAVLNNAVYWPCKEEILCNMPKCFANFKNTRIVLDCTEIPVEIPKCLKCRLRLYSHYKGRETLKLLLGVTPSGQISYISKCYGGRASDKAIFLQSCLLEKLIPRADAVMVDKGFLIEPDCASHWIKVIIPPRLKHRKQLSRDDAMKTRTIARARIHVERAIQRMKVFKIMKATVPWHMVKYMDHVCLIIAGLVNLSAPILSNDKF